MKTYKIDEEKNERLDKTVSNLETELSNQELSDEMKESVRRFLKLKETVRRVILRQVMSFIRLKKMTLLLKICQK